MKLTPMIDFFIPGNHTHNTDRLPKTPGDINVEYPVEMPLVRFPEIERELERAPKDDVFIRERFLPDITIGIDIPETEELPETETDRRPGFFRIIA